MAKLNATACMRCREQKVKCSRNKPICQRCAQSRTQCSYPEPPDRSSLAKARIAQKRARRAQAATTEQSDMVQEMERPVEQESPLQRSTGDLPNQRLQRLLINVYLNNMWNAHMLFHKPTLLADFEVGAIPTHLLLALCAAATIHLRSEMAPIQEYTDLINVFPDITDTGRQWAEVAGRETLSGIDQPTMARVQACNLLDLYWISADEPERSIMFSNIACAAASALQLDEIQTGKNSRMDAELQRRTFWTVWIANCVKSDRNLPAAFPQARILNLPLPIDDEVLSSPSDIEHVTLSMINEQQIQPSPRRSKSWSISAGLVQFMTIWTSLGSYLECRKTQSARKSLPQLMDLDESLLKWDKNLPRQWQYSRRNLYEQVVVKQQRSYILVHCIRHQCSLVLRSSLVPQFSGMTWNGEDHTDVISVSARVALRSAGAISDIAKDLVALEFDFGQLPPFIGYCMYASAAIHILFLFSKNTVLSEMARMKLDPTIKVLRVMKETWRSLERLWSRVALLYDVQVSKGHERSAEVDPSIAAGLRDGDQDSGMVDENAHEQRATGQLEEPLADSMLRFNLRLRPKAVRTKTASGFPFRQFYQDPLSQIFQQSLRTGRAFGQPPNMGSSMFIGQYDMPTCAQVGAGPETLTPADSVMHNSANSDLLSFADQDLSQTFTNVLPEISTNASDFRQPDDWWNVDLEGLSQTILALGDSIDFDAVGYNSIQP